MKTKVSIPFMLAGILFTVCLIISNLLETKVIRLGFVTATAGLMVFPVSYIINDCIVEVWGYAKARLVIWIGFAVNFLVVGLTQLAILMPPAPYWEGEAAFNFVFGLSARIVVGSLCAFLVGSFINAWVMSRMKVLSDGKYFSLRAIVSTLAGESADSIIFFPIAFAGIISWDNLLVLMATQIVLKSLYEVLVLPLTIRIVRVIKRIDGCDAYDRHISFNPFELSSRDGD
ncbi:MAG: queuosine precursor transporter [Tannerella sp.]|jgi:uncharacterized integral membrane protein (TIGR00697 family)|nr:queuosine precursor transporter [Tannerella sp.]